MNRIVRAGLTMGFALAIALAGSASAHTADASLNCSSEGVTLHVQSSAYPNGSWFDYSIDGGVVKQVQTGLTINVNAGSPTVSHTAYVQFHSTDGKTQFNFTFNLSSESCVQRPTPTPTPVPTPSPTPSASPSATPVPTPSATPSEKPSVPPTIPPRFTLPPTDVNGAEVAAGGNISLILAAIIGVATGLYLLARPGDRRKRINRR